MGAYKPKNLYEDGSAKESANQTRPVGPCDQLVAVTGWAAKKWDLLGHAQSVHVTG